MNQGPKSSSLPASTNCRLKGNESSMSCHGNLWQDDFIQSLNSPYGEPVYRERVEKLIQGIKPLFLSDMEYGDDDDLIKRLQLVDTVECLGVDRHFQPEIKLALDDVYRYWNERESGVRSRGSLCKDLNATALGFRTLRLHRYNVSSGVFEKFKDGNREFHCLSSTCEEGDERVGCMLSLFRASNISFPGETVMDEAKTFTTKYLNQVLAGEHATSVDENILREVKYAMEFPWHCSVPRWEARNFIEIRGQNVSWLKLNINKNLLELAKLDFNILQSAHQKEIQLISRWWRDFDVKQLEFYRKRHVEFYLWVVVGTFEPEFSASRIAFAKLCTMLTLLDDLYEDHGSLDDLRIFAEGVKRWDLSLTESLPEHVRISLKVLFDTSNEFAAEIVKKQGRDITSFIRKQWGRFVGSYLKEAEWKAARYVPTFDEYIENGNITSGICIVNLCALLLMDHFLPDSILEQVYSPSKIQDLLELTTRLTDDARDFEIEEECGKLATGIGCYMKDNPQSTVEDALRHVNDIIDRSLKELNSVSILHEASNSSTDMETDSPLLTRR